MVLPVTPITRSALLDGKSNGRLPTDILSSIPGVAGGAPITLVKPAARAWEAMAGVAKKAGHILKSSWPTNSYRPYEDQKRIFLQRYTTVPQSGQRCRMWEGRCWYKKPGVAAAAVPGTSNHGWGQAVDGGEERDGDGSSEPFDSGTMSWLLQHADEFGWSWEIQSEPWHLHYFAGDAIPAAVLAWERAQDKPEPEPEPEDDDDVRYLIKKDGTDGRWWVTDGIFKRHVDDRVEARVLVGSKLATADGTNSDGSPKPFVWPAALVDDLKDVNS